MVIFRDSEELSNRMPICPKCHKLVSASKYERHLKRCGVKHKHAAAPLDHPENFFMKI